MPQKLVALKPLSDFPLWKNADIKRIPFSFELEITARCNNDCRHCYINLPVADAQAKENEISIGQIAAIADQAVKLGSLWCLLTGGEPLLREDFGEIYLMLKKKGLLVSVFTNACLVNDKHVELFKKYPPRNMEISVYGATAAIYETVTRRQGSYTAFRHGLDRLLQNKIKVRLKAMALRSNISGLEATAAFCRRHTKDFYRFDPLLHLRFDGNPFRNAEIIRERLTPEEISAIEQSDEERSISLGKNCEQYIFPASEHTDCRHLFHCGAGNSSFSVSQEGIFRPCSSLWHPECVYDLKKGTLAEAWKNLVPRVRALASADPEFLKKCRGCPIVNLCLWCPAHAYLESGRLDAWNEYFCKVAHARAAAIDPDRAK